MKFIFKKALLVLRLVLNEKTRMHNGRIVKEHSNEIIREINMIKPKSIIGFISVIIKDPKATIVVSVVYRQGQNMFFNVTNKLFSSYSSNL